jgi:hypothetical protein
VPARRNHVEAETVVTLTGAGVDASEQTGARRVERSSKWQLVERLKGVTEMALGDLAKEFGRPRAGAIIQLSWSASAT